jgi:hypothetical protein
VYLVAESSITGSTTGNQTRQGKIQQGRTSKTETRQVSQRKTSTNPTVKALQDKEVANRVGQESARAHRAQAKQRTSQKIGDVSVMKTKSVIIDKERYNKQSMEQE